jgi:8-oxo-dGTP pyrophosphatase MutT (NUDIX family)
MMQRLKETLAQRQKHHLVDPRLTPSAVLIPLFFKDGEYNILFIKRTERVKVHKGQISFPGGACEKEDATTCNTALRECTEEVGIPANSVEVLGELDDFFTMGSGYIIHPFVGTIPWPLALKVDGHETESVIEVPISALLDKNSLREQVEVINGEEIPTYFYHYKDNVIWGATARILAQFLEIWDEVGEAKH